MFDNKWIDIQNKSFQSIDFFCIWHKTRLLNKTQSKNDKILEMRNQSIVLGLE